MSNQTTAEIIAEQARDLYHDTIYSAITASDIEQADAYTNEHLKLTVEVMDALGVFHVSDRMLVAIAQAMRWTLEDLEAQAIEEAHEAAAAALISAYAEAIGDSVTADDPEAIAAHRVARACIGLATATDDDRATVSAMVEAIADAASEAAAFKAYKLNVPYLVWEDDPETMTPENYAAEAAAFSFIEAYAGASLFRPSETDPEFIAAFHVAADEVAGVHIATDADRATVADMLEEIADDTAWSAAYATLHKDPDVTPEEMREIMDNPRAYLMAAARAEAAAAPIYQRYELLAYLGDPDAYDIEAIEAEATRYTADGARVWSAFGEDLAAIAERHEIVTYYAI